MKRIYGMSVSRSYLIGKLQGYANVIYEHIIKIVTAPKTGNIQYVDKWIGDISKAIYNASGFTLDKGKRLSAKVYQEELFDSMFGNTEHDILLQLEAFQDDYPEFGIFEVDEELAKTTLNVVSELRELIPNMIAEHKGNKGILIPTVKSQIGQIVRKYIYLINLEKIIGVNNKGLSLSDRPFLLSKINLIYR